jgi:hypothetical protein
MVLRSAASLLESHGFRVHAITSNDDEEQLSVTSATKDELDHVLPS